MTVLRVLEVTTELKPAGAERVVFDLATRLPSLGIRASVAAVRGRDDPLAARLRAAGVEVFELDLRGKWDLPRAARLVPIARRFDLIHAHLFHADVLSRLAGRVAGVPVVSTYQVVEGRRLPLRFAADRATGRLARLFTCISEDVRRFVRRTMRHAAARTVVVRSGVDVAAIRAGAGAAPAARVRAEIGAGERPIVLAVARLDRQKGLDLLIRALPAVRAASPSVVLALAGDGPERAALADLAARLGVGDAVRFLGHRTDVPALLGAATVFCLPSRWEGLGLAALEAMAAGAPVVATAVPGLREAVGPAGVLVPPEDPAALASALAALLTSPDRRAALAAAGSRRVEAQFRVERMVEEYADIFRRVAGSSPFVRRRSRRYDPHIRDEGGGPAEPGPRRRIAR